MNFRESKNVDAENVISVFYYLYPGYFIFVIPPYPVAGKTQPWPIMSDTVLVS